MMMSLVAIAGCSPATADPPKSGGHRPIAQSDSVPLTNGGELQVAATTPRGQAASTARQSVVPDLGTRKQGTDWPCFLGPTGDSKSSEKRIVTRWTPQSPRIVWQRKLGTSYGAPTVSKGRLFQFDRPAKPDQATLVCLHAETGKELWSFGYASEYQDMFGYNNGPRCSPVVDDDRVYIFGAEGMLHCLSVLDGKVLWKIDTAQKYRVVQNFFGVGSTPVVEGDLLIVQIGGSTKASLQIPPGQLDLVKGDGMGVVAFDKYTGEERYRLSDELASYASPVLATIDGRRWCFVLARGGLLGFEPRTGKLDFHFPWRAESLESVNASNPVVVGNRVFLSETYGPGSVLLEVSAGGCQVVWSDEKKFRNKSMQTHWNTAVHHEGYLYGSSGRHTNNAELRCIELATGKVMWSVPDLTRSSLLYIDGHFVCLTEVGELILFKANPQKFEPVGQLLLTEDSGEGNAAPAVPGFGPRPLLKYPAWAAPIVSHGLLYVRGEDRLVCLELIPERKD
jgi:outer membrane protein assembly factor BamB